MVVVYLYLDLSVCVHDAEACLAVGEAHQPHHWNAVS